MRTRYLGQRNEDLVWLQWAKNQCHLCFGYPEANAGVKRRMPVEGLLVTYGKDAAGLFVEVLRIGVYQHVAVTLPNPVPSRTLYIDLVGERITHGIEYTLDSSSNTGLQVSYVRTLHVTVEGVEVESYTGSWVYDFTTTGMGVKFTYSNWVGADPGSVHNVPEGYVANGVHDTTSGATVSNVTVTPIPGYLDAAQAAIDASPNRQRTVVITSDGVEIAEEALVYDTVWGETPSQVLEFYSGLIYQSGQNNPLARTPFSWNGGSNAWMFSYRGGDGLFQRFDHKLTFTVPDDCVCTVLPTPSHPPYPGVDGATYAAQWASDWAAGQAQALARNEAWLLSNHATVITGLKTGLLPKGWDHALKYKSPFSLKTLRSPVMSGTHTDETLSDTTSNLTQPGVRVVRRTVPLTYTIGIEQPDGSVVATVRSQTIVGTLTTIVTHHTKPQGTIYSTSNKVYSNWYVPEGTPNPASVPTDMPHQFLRDNSATGLGLVWNGVIQDGKPVSSSPLPWNGYTPPYPQVSESVVGTAPDIVNTFRAEVKPAYVQTGSANWNDSALTDGELVKIILFGPKDKGIFGKWPVAPDTLITSVHVYGAATFRYSYSTGAFSLTSFTRPKKSNGEEVDAIEVPLNGAPQPTGNSYVRYGDLVWKDARDAAKAAEALLKPPEPPAQDNRTAAQKFQYAVCTSV